MKNYIKIILILFVVTNFYNCKEDFLDIDKEGEIKSEVFFKTDKDAIASVNYVYAKLRDWDTFGGFPFQAITGIPGDDMEKGSAPTDALYLNEYDNFKYTSAQEMIDGFWRGFYKNITNTNQVINNVPTIEMDQNLKIRIIAEARFLRALHYFYLVRAFGGVPIIKTFSIESQVTPRSSQQEVYEFIIDDLQYAIQNLPTNYSGDDIGRATKGAALSYLAKVYLYLKDYQKSYDLTSQVEALGYKLEPSFYNLFRPPFENGVESIFEVQATPTNQGSTEWAYYQGPRDRDWGGWGFFTPSQELNNSFETNDLRRDATILYRGETTPDGDFIDPTTTPNPMYTLSKQVFGKNNID